VSEAPKNPDSLRVKIWRQQNRERYNAQMHNYLREPERRKKSLKLRLPHKYVPREYQLPFWQAMEGVRSGRF
jgi:hypothetical protein